MKKILPIVLIICFISTFTSKAYARDKDWERAGKIVAGLVGFTILADAVTNDNHHRTNNHKRRHYAYKNSPVRTYVEGHYETYNERIFIPEQRRSIWVEPEYAWSNRCKRGERILVREGYYTCEIIPAHYEIQPRQRFIEGYWIEESRGC